MPDRTIHVRRNAPDFTMTENDIKDFIAQIGNQRRVKGLMDLIVLLCNTYDNELAKGETPCSDRLLDLEIALSERWVSYREWKNFQKTANRELLQKIMCDFNDWLNVNPDGTKYGFYKFSCNGEEADNVDKYESCKTKFLDLCSCLVKEADKYIMPEDTDGLEFECASGENYPFIAIYGRKTLETFLYYLSVAFINDKLPLTLDYYIDVVESKKPAHRKKGESDTPLFKDIYPKWFTQEQIAEKKGEI